MVAAVIAGMVLLASNFAMAVESNKATLKTKPVSVTIHGYDWNGDIPSQAVVVVNNSFGNIRVRNHGENKVFLHAVYQKLGDRPLEPNFAIEKKDGKWYIDVRYSEDIHYKTGKLRGRADLAILFPPHVKIDASTDFGMIKVDRSSSDVMAKSQSGEIKLTTTGLFNVSSKTGEIGLKLRGFKHAGQSVARTSSGNINAEVFSDMDLMLSAKTKGKIAENGKVVKGKSHIYHHGSQLSKLDLVSKKGNIELEIVTPPALVKSVKPVSVKQDLRDLPKAKAWQPGDPIVERGDKIDHSLKTSKKSKK